MKVFNRMYRKLFIMGMTFVMVTSSPGYAARMGDKDRLESTSPLATSYSIDYIEEGSGRLLHREDQVDGLVGERLEVNESFINIFRSYKYKEIRDGRGRRDKESLDLVLEADPEENKVYIVYEAMGADGGVSIKKKLNKEEKIKYINGYSDGSLRPEGRISREEVAAAFFRILDGDYRDSLGQGGLNFNDLEDDRWSYPYISSLSRGNVLTGYDDGSFRPKNPVTRGELVAIASRLVELEGEKGEGFSDIEGHWSEDYIKSALSQGWVMGYGDGSFKPDAYVSRAEFVSLVNGLLERRPSPGPYLDTGFKDLDQDSWYYPDMLEALYGTGYSRMG